MKKYVTDINDGLYLKEYNVKESKSNNNLIKINSNEEITKYLGMGGAITESTAYNYDLLKNKKAFLDDCYSKEGLNFSLGRIAIGSNDFTIKSFEYTKKKDLSDFKISHDEKYVIPMLKDILRIKKISLIASPWSPPKMYKRLRLLRYGTKLRKKYYERYSDYIIKYLEEYQKRGIEIDYITPQNEPMARQKWESCKFSLANQKEFVYDYLLPKLKKTKVLLFDHNKDDLYNIFKYLYQDHNQIAGLAFHYYSGSYFDEIKKIREDNAKTLLVSSESCCGYSLYQEKNWIKDAEIILRDVIGDMNNGTNSYLYWNLLLDEHGGPTYIKNYVKSPIIRKDIDYLKTPIYYYLYHVSHFININSLIIKNESFINDLKVLSFKDKASIKVIVMNDKNKSFDYNIMINNKVYRDTIKPHSIVTYIEK